MIIVTFGYSTLYFLYFVNFYFRDLYGKVGLRTARGQKC